MKLFQGLSQGHRWFCNLKFKFFCLIAIIPVSIFRLLFIITYPINNLGGDTGNYFNMMLDGKSSLVHASGYPFLFGFLLNDFRSFFQAHPFISGYFLLVPQHAIEILCMLLLLWVLHKLYNRYVAILSIWLWGLNVWAASTTNSVYPEWFQSVLLITSLCLVYLAYKMPIGRKKLLFYCLAALIFFWCYLVKFNVLYFVLVFIFVFFLEKIQFKTKIFYTLAIILLIAINLAFFLVFYHEPSTGTFSLTYDHAWVLTDRVSSLLSPENGVNSKRLILLNAILPQKYSAAGPVTYSHVNAVPSDERIIYQDVYQEIMTADEKKLDSMLKSHSLPKNFNPYYSSVVISYYVGLAESDDLGTKVYFETVAKHPFEFVTSVLERSLETLTERVFAPLTPVNGLFEQGIYEQDKSLKWGFQKYELINGDYWNVAYWNINCILWQPGIDFFSKIDSAMKLPPLLGNVFILLGIFAMIGLYIRNKRITLQGLIFIGFALLILGFVLYSNLIVYFRWKDARLIFPIMCSLYSIALYNLIRYLPIGKTNHK